MPEPVVVDNSFLGAYFIPDEDPAHTVPLLKNLEHQTVALHAPSLYLIEFSNMLVVSLRRQRLTQDEFHAALADVRDLHIQIHGHVSYDSLARQTALAQRHGLSFYDALYLDLAITLSASLATLDTALLTAAPAEAVTLYPV